MANKDDKKEQGAGSLAAAAAAMRDAGRRGKREEDRTTLEMSEPGTGAPDALGELLVARGLISRHQLFNALNESYRTNTTLGQALIAMGILDAATLEKAIKDAS